MISKRKPKKQKPPHTFGANPKILQVLETTSLKEIKEHQETSRLFLGYWYQYYSSLAFSRAGMMEELQDAVRRQTMTNYEFNDWGRIVKYRWALNPLSAEGSVLADGGGRFNIGEIDASRFPTFPALYLAENEETGKKEVYGIASKEKGLDVIDYSLVAPDSHAFVRVHGLLETVFDLTRIENLKPYFELIKKIKFPKYVEKTAKILKLGSPKTVKSVLELHRTFLEPNWRIFPMQCDIPANSQIFGQLVESAGIQGIIYPSSKGTGRCLAVYPRNFNNSSSFVTLSDPHPEGANVVNKLDASTWKKLV